MSCSIVLWSPWSLTLETMVQLSIQLEMGLLFTDVHVAIVHVYVKQCVHFGVVMREAKLLFHL